MFFLTRQKEHRVICQKVLKMKITDNGKGMDENTVSKGIGLRNIGSRLSIFNGVMRIETKPGEGFALEVEMPVS